MSSTTSAPGPCRRPGPREGPDGRGDALVVTRVDWRDAPVVRARRELHLGREAGGLRVDHGALVDQASRARGRRPAAPCTLAPATGDHTSVAGCGKLTVPPSSGFSGAGTSVPRHLEAARGAPLGRRAVLAHAAHAPPVLAVGDGDLQRRAGVPGVEVVVLVLRHRRVEAGVGGDLELVVVARPRPGPLERRQVADGRAVGRQHRLGAGSAAENAAGTSMSSVAAAVTAAQREARSCTVTT